MATKTKPQTEVKSGLVIRKIGTLTKPMIHHISTTVTP